MLAPLVAGTFFGVMAVCGLLTGKHGARGGKGRQEGAPGLVPSRRNLDGSWGAHRFACILYEAGTIC